MAEVSNICYLGNWFKKSRIQKLFIKNWSSWSTY